MKQKHYPNVWRAIFYLSLLGIITILALTFYFNSEEPTQEQPYIYQDIIDNKQHYILKNNYNISHYTETFLMHYYNVSSENLTKTLNISNTILLYNLVRNNFAHGVPERPVEVLERGRGATIGLHSLFSSILLTLDNSTNIYLLLTETPYSNNSAVLVLLNHTTYYFDLTLGRTNITFDRPIEVLKINESYVTLPLVRYAVGTKEVNYFKRDIDYYFWLEEKYKENGW